MQAQISLQEQDELQNTVQEAEQVGPPNSILPSSMHQSPDQRNNAASVRRADIREDFETIDPVEQ